MPADGSVRALKKDEMCSFTNYIGGEGSAASSKTIRLVLFSEQNLERRLDFRNFGQSAARQGRLRHSVRPEEIPVEPGAVKSVLTRKILFL